MGVALGLILLVGFATVVFIAWVVGRLSSISVEQESIKNRLLELEKRVETLLQSAAKAQASAPGKAVEAESIAAAAKDRLRNLEARVESMSGSGGQAAVSEVAAPPVMTSTPAAAPTGVPPISVPPMPESGQVFASTSPPPEAPEAAPVRPSLSLPSINWEQFMGVKLFAWIGGVAAFLFVVFGLKYSFEHNLISPPVRVGAGFFVGLALVVGGVVLSRRKYAVLSQTLCATGVVILYAVTFACHAVYHFPFFSTVPSFALMVVITVGAFTLAVRMDAMVVAILGMLGGFLTPILVSTGQDNPGALFGYVALLDAGLVGVILMRRWNFLVVLAALATVGMEAGWVVRFFEAEKIHVAQVVFLGSCALFLIAKYLARRRGEATRWFSAAALIPPAAALLFCVDLLTIRALASRPETLFAIAFGADLCVLALVMLDDRFFLTQVFSGMGIFVLLGLWVGFYVDSSLLYWALGLAMVFAGLHAFFPIVLRHFRGGKSPTASAHLFPVFALLVIMLPIAHLRDISLWVWPFVLVIDAIAVGVAILSGSLLVIGGVLIVTLLSTVLWLFQIPASVSELPALLTVVGGFGVFFFAATLFAAKQILAKSATEKGKLDDVYAQLPAISAVSPFLLLILITAHVPLTSPTPVFGVAMFLVVLLLGLARVFALEWIPAAGLAGALALEYVWHSERFGDDVALVSLGWYLAFYAVFTVFPYVFWRRFSERTPPWAIAALAGPLHFFLVHDVVKRVFPEIALGLVPAAFAVPALAGVWFLVRNIPRSNPQRVGQLAWVTGVALFFITIIFPVQFQKQWITLGWALEGAALLWLFHRVPHPGLRVTGVALLAIAFVRLGLNPAVIHYYQRTGTPILNWYLYTYGVGAVCMLVGARLLSPPRNWIGKFNTQPLLYTLGVVLIFVLLNIEIADYFGEGSQLRFDFSGNLARDMTYTIAWSVFAFGLLVLGIVKSVRAIRYASVGLLTVAILKLFFHDLANLGALYRLGALISVAVIAFLASFVYQKFFNVKVVK